MEAILQPMLLWYKDQLDTSCELLELLGKQRQELTEENRELRQRLDHVHIQLAEAQYRADALHRVLDVMVDRQAGQVRRDLMDAFNEVADEIGVELEMSDVETEMEDFEREMFDL